MTALSDYILQVRTLVHDLLSLDYTDTEVTNYVNNARQRVALDAHCVRSFFGGPTTFLGTAPVQWNLIQNQEIYPFSGGIPGCSVPTPGGPFVTPPLLTFATPPGGTGNAATGTVSLNAQGGLNQVTMTSWGSTYLTPGVVSIAPNIGGAVINPVGMLNVHDILSITFLYPGSTNREMLRWLTFTLYQAWCRSYVLQTGPPRAWTAHREQNLLFIYPIPDQIYQVEIDFITQPNNLVNTTDLETQVPLPFTDAVQYYAAFLARTKLQDYEKAEYWRRMYNTRIRELTATVQDRRMPNVYRQSARRMMRW